MSKINDDEIDDDDDDDDAIFQSWYSGNVNPTSDAATRNIRISYHSVYSVRDTRRFFRLFSELASEVFFGGEGVLRLLL